MAAKNLYNAANYLVRQSFIFQGTYLDHVKVFHLLKTHEAYRALPAKVSNSILIQLHKAWKSFFEGMEEWKAHPEKFVGRPKLPKYKHKEQGRFLLTYDTQAIGKRIFKKTGMLAPSGLTCRIPTKITDWKKIDQLRIVPRTGFYVVEVVYHKDIEPKNVDPTLIAALDVGVNVLAAMTSNKEGFVPRLVSGKPLKSLNQYYNKQREHHQKRLSKGKQKRHTSHALDQLTTKRNRRVQHYLHVASRRIIELCVQEGIGTLVVGKNVFWKQEGDKTIKRLFRSRTRVLSTCFATRENWSALSWKPTKKATPVKPASSILTPSRRIRPRGKSALCSLGNGLLGAGIAPVMGASSMPTSTAVTTFYAKVAPTLRNWGEE